MPAGAALRCRCGRQGPEGGVALRRWVPGSMRSAGYRFGPMQPRSSATVLRSVQQLAIVVLAVLAPLAVAGHVGATPGVDQRGAAARTTTTTRPPSTVAPTTVAPTTAAPTTVAPTTVASTTVAPAPSTPPTAGVSTTTPALQDRANESSQATTRLNRVAIGLIALAAIIAAATVFFWIRTRPDNAGGHRGGRSDSSRSDSSRRGRRGATVIGADGSQQPLVASSVGAPDEDRWTVDPAPQLPSTTEVGHDAGAVDA